MSFEEKIKEFVKNIPEKLEHIDSEETTKIALILPLLREMGYDTTNPMEVKAEYTADIGSKKGEKIDMAILVNASEEMLIECKPANQKLDLSHISQLYRYYNITHAHLGILTNGLTYYFFTDSKHKGKMDDKPFLEINLMDLSSKDIQELEKFTKEKYNVGNILARVDTLKYSNEIKKCITKEIETPSEEFVKVIAKQVFDGVLTKKNREMFRKIVQNTFKEIINEKVEKRLADAIKNPENEPIEDIETPEIVTTDEELEGYHIIKAILSEIIDTNRVAIRDRKNYCGILLDDNQYYTICRLHFNNKNNLYISLFAKFETAANGRKIADKVKLNNVSDIYKHRNKIKNTVIEYNRIKK
jgi:predicted type IV restriction endonuclease